MAFVDEATIFVRGGRGGDGSASLHSEPFKPRGGPDGGDGGEGGAVVLQVSPGVHDLFHLGRHPHQAAAPGVPGSSGKRHGADGDDLVIPVPDGTVVKEGEELIADLVGEGARAVVARGGRGGRGTAALAGPKNRVPRTAEAGEPGEERRLHLELRLVADIGLVGSPNAGKSTLLAALTAARPKVAAYPFTTLTPNLGVTKGEERFVVADVPGLIEGAHEGKGLGDRFLRHVTRCRALVHVVDLASPDAAENLAAVRRELEAYDPELAGRPSLVVATKADLVDDPGLRASALGEEVAVVSGLTGDGVEELALRLEDLAGAAAEAAGERRTYVVLRPGRQRFVVRREGKRYRVIGRDVERWVAETDLDDPRAVVALQRRLAKEGVERQLEEAGAHRGDEVVIADRTFEFFPEASRPGD